jgi:hypothetical protein
MLSPRVVSPLCSFGHVASYRELHDRWGAESAVLPFRHPNGRVVLWLRPDAYACGHLSDDELLAVRIGAHLDCLSVLTTLASPTAATALAESGGAHVRLAPNDGRASARRFAEARPVTAHWSVPRQPPPSLVQTRAAVRSGRDPLSRVSMPPSEALRQALRGCLSDTDGAAVIAELRASGSLDVDELARVVASSSRRVRKGLRDAGLPAEVMDSLEGLR